MSNNAEYNRERYQWLKDHHMCIKCSKQDYRTLEGFVCCEECAEKARKQNRKKGRIYRARYVEKHPEAVRDQLSRYYEKHKDDPEFKAKRADICARWQEKNRDKWNAYQREYRRNRKAKGGTE